MLGDADSTARTSSSRSMLSKLPSTCSAFVSATNATITQRGEDGERTIPLTYFPPPFTQNDRIFLIFYPHTITPTPTRVRPCHPPPRLYHLHDTRPPTTHWSPHL